MFRPPKNATQARLTGLYPGATLRWRAHRTRTGLRLSDPLRWSAVAAAQQVENLALGVLDAVQAAVLQVERLLERLRQVEDRRLRPPCANDVVSEVAVLSGDFRRRKLRSDDNFRH